MWDALALKTESVRHESGLAILRNADPEIEDVICRATFVSTYVLDEGGSHWSRAESEGALYIVKRSSLPTYRLIVLNQRHPVNLVENITAHWELSSEQNYIFFRVPKDPSAPSSEPKGRRVVGLWFSEDSERQVVQARISKIIFDQKIPTLPTPPKSTPVFSSSETPDPTIPVENHRNQQERGDTIIQPPTNSRPRSRYQIASRLSQIAPPTPAPPQDSQKMNNVGNTTKDDNNNITNDLISPPSVPDPPPSSHPLSLLSQFRQAFGLATHQTNNVAPSPPTYSLTQQSSVSVTKENSRRNIIAHSPTPDLPSHSNNNKDNNIIIDKPLPPQQQTSSSLPSAMSALLSNRVLKFMRRTPTGTSLPTQNESTKLPTPLKKEDVEINNESIIIKESTPDPLLSNQRVSIANRYRRHQRAGCAKGEGGELNDLRNPDVLLKRLKERLLKKKNKQHDQLPTCTNDNNVMINESTSSPPSDTSSVFIVSEDKLLDAFKSVIKSPVFINLLKEQLTNNAC